MRSSPRIHFKYSLSRPTRIPKILSSRDATVMIWMFLVFTTRMRPSAAVVEDSVGSSPSRNVLVSRSSPVTSIFPPAFAKRPGFTLFSRTLQRGMIHRRIDEQTRAHALNKSAASALPLVVSEQQARRSPDPHPSVLVAQRLSSIPVGTPGFVKKSNCSRRH